MKLRKRGLGRFLFLKNPTAVDTAATLTANYLRTWNTGACATSGTFDKDNSFRTRWVD